MYAVIFRSASQVLFVSPHERQFVSFNDAYASIVAIKNYNSCVDPAGEIRIEVRLQQIDKELTFWLAPVVAISILVCSHREHSNHFFNHLH